MTGADDWLPGPTDWEQASAVARGVTVGSEGLLEKYTTILIMRLSDGPQSLFPDQFD
jgi:hypothetical protein